MPEAPKILVFDSGAGGLSVAGEIIKTLPGCTLAYGADNAFFPYGLKDDAVLTARIVTQIESLYRKIVPDLVVIACNTASTLALETLRNEFPCPFVGVVPAIKPAALATKTGVIGVLATPATVARTYTHRLIEEFAIDRHVVLHGSNALVTIAEEKLTTGDLPPVKNEIESLFAQERGDEIDTVVLACTHFPLLIEEIKKHSPCGQEVRWIDSGQAIAKRVLQLLPVHANSKTRFRCEFYFSEPVAPKLEARYLNYLSRLV